jgi:hypothetical protein
MSDQTELNWDDVLGEVEQAEAQDKKDGKSDSDFEALPKGPYPVVVQSAEKQVASTGKDMIKVQLQVSEGPYVNRILFNYFVFGKKEDVTLNKITLNNLAAFGITRDLIATQRPGIAEIAEMLEGLSAIAKVGIQEKGDYKGRNEVKGFSPLNGAPAPVVAAATKAGVPNLPQPAAPEAAAPAAPSIPLPDVPVGAGDAEDPLVG